MRRRMIYLLGIFIFFGTLIGVPLAIYTRKVPTCFDGIQNQGETDIDRGGPCVLLDERVLLADTVLWARGFTVRPGEYNAVAYVLNPNGGAGTERVDYKFSLYDVQNILVAEDVGSTYIMPGAVTPVFNGGIKTGNRRAAHTIFTFTSKPIWKRMANTADNITVSNKVVTDVGTVPRISAVVKNLDVKDITNVTLVATVFDTAGNAFASSRTLVPSLAGGEETTVVFTWPNPFTSVVGQIDILPLHPPVISNK